MLVEQAKAIRESETSGMVALDRSDLEKMLERARLALDVEEDFWQ
jgi:hypothetical protein